jgi:hypothetical protein
VVVLIFDVVVSDPAGLIAGALVLALYVLAWVALPLVILQKARDENPAEDKAHD